MREGLEALRAAGAGLRRPYYLSLLAQTGEPERFDEALGLVEASGESWIVPELLRLKGDTLSSRDEREAEACYRHALDVARKQGARAFEARVLASLERLKNGGRTLSR